MHITPEMLEAAYEYMRTTPPFKRWKLPSGEDVEFHVTRHAGIMGDHTTYVGTDKHIIRLSAKHVSRSDTLLATMGHEMIHMCQTIQGTGPQRPGHNYEFKRLHRLMCKLHGWPITDI